jgi:hypothetical protein
MWIPIPVLVALLLYACSNASTSHSYSYSSYPSEEERKEKERKLFLKKFYAGYGLTYRKPGPGILNFMYKQYYGFTLKQRLYVFVYLGLLQQELEKALTYLKDPTYTAYWQKVDFDQQKKLPFYTDEGEEEAPNKRLKKFFDKQESTFNSKVLPVLASDLQSFQCNSTLELIEKGRAISRGLQEQFRKSGEKNWVKFWTQQNPNSHTDGISSVLTENGIKYRPAEEY